jgi:hypothetical protein
MTNQLPAAFRRHANAPKSSGRNSWPSSSAGRRAGGSHCSHGRAVNHRLTVQGERPRLRRGRGGSDGGIAIGPVISAAGEEAHHLAVAADDQPISVMFDFVHPIRPRRRLVSERRDAGSTKPSARTTSMVRQIAADERLVESQIAATHRHNRSAVNVSQARATAVVRRLAPGVPFGEGRTLSAKMMGNTAGRDRQRMSVEAAELFLQLVQGRGRPRP